MYDNTLSDHLLQTLAYIGKTLSSSLNREEVYKGIVQNVPELLNPCAWALSLLTDDEHIQYKRIVNMPNVKSEIRSSKEHPLWAHISQIHEGLLWNQPDQNNRDPKPNLIEMEAPQGFSLIAAPMSYQNRAYGILELWRKDKEKPPFTNADLNLLKIVADFAAIALENAKNFSRVEELTFRDELTNLINFRHLQNLLSQEISRSIRYHKDLSMIFIDLDQFKQVNDTHGHLVGSKLLKSFAELLASLTRNVDVACRYGGDEFVVMLPETSKANAIFLAERIREALEKHRFLGENNESIKITGSFGVAAFPDDAQNSKELLQRADQAMYQAKEKQRNCVVPFEAKS